MHVLLYIYTYIYIYVYAYIYSFIFVFPGKFWRHFCLETMALYSQKCISDSLQLVRNLIVCDSFPFDCDPNGSPVE